MPNALRKHEVIARCIDMNSAFPDLLSMGVNWVSLTSLVAVAVFACIAYYRPLFVQRRAHVFMMLAGVVVALRFLFAGIKTVLQYVAWTRSDFTKLFLPPHQRIVFFLHYSWTHFWLNAFISVGVALLFFGILRVLQSYNHRYFESGETELGFVMALVVGWPQFIVFAPVVFLSVVAIGVIRGIFLRDPYTTLGLPFFIAAVVAMGLTPLVATVFKLTAFFI